MRTISAPRVLSASLAMDCSLIWAPTSVPSMRNATGGARPPVQLIQATREGRAKRWLGMQTSHHGLPPQLQWVHASAALLRPAKSPEVGRSLAKTPSFLLWETSSRYLL